MRDTAGVSEVFFWEYIRKDRLGFRFRRQVSVGKYVLDFYCAAAQLAIELDGEVHGARADRDKVRDEFLSGCKIEVVRIPTEQLFDPDKLGQWLDMITQRCQSRLNYFDGLREQHRQRERKV